MAKRVHFTKTDIGGEILPILTMGLYRDTLDALREYIQNSIDANANDIEIIIDPDTVMIADTGDGMDSIQARKALRFGISDKNPKKNIGFRGIGIYSGFNLCDSLEIFTKAEGAKSGHHITFDFRTIRIQLLAEQERRKEGQPPQLHLEGLLEDTVYVEDDVIGIIENKGTKVIMSGLLPDAYETLLDWSDVEAYLQDVVPLPFRPDFKFARAIEKKFSEEDYRVVPVTLQINKKRSPLYRPYTNELFTKGGIHPPKYITLGRGSNRFGFAWICISDERKALKNTALRGLLIKKFGFSVANRSYLEPYFPRTVFNRRITGEIIVQNADLLPNAARSDFENNSARHEFLRLIPVFIKQLSTWANGVQQEDKAREILLESTDKLARISNELPAARRDKDKILGYNIQLATIDSDLKVHHKTLISLEDLQDQYLQVQQALKADKEFVRNAVLETTKSYKKLESDVQKTVKAQQSLKQAPTVPEQKIDIVSILEGTGIQLANDVRRAILLFESECLLTHLDRDIYNSILLELKEILEEKF